MRNNNLWSKTKQRGYVTIIVIWVSALLVITASGLALYVRYQSRSLKNYGDYLKSYYIAAAGAYDVIYAEFSRGGKLKLSRFDGINDLNAANTNVSFGGGTYTAIFEDEGGKSNINNAPIKVVRDLLTDLDLDDAEKKAQGILNWKKENGGLFFNVEELGLVPELDVNDVFTLLPYFTIYNSNSSGAINVNTASIEVLRAYMKEFNAPDSLAAQIIEHRPFDNEIGEFIRSRAPKMQPAFVNYFCASSNSKRVRVVAGIEGKTLAKVNAVFDVWASGGHETVFIRYFWQE